MVLTEEHHGCSVIVCTYNGLSLLPFSLPAIMAQQVPAAIPWELIVVDNASSDDTLAWCQQFKKESPLSDQIKIIHEATPGLNYARLAGLKAAQYSWVLFCDDDNRLNENYIHLGMSIITQNPLIGVLGGMGSPVSSIPFPEWFQKYRHSYAVGPQAPKSGKIDQFPVYVYGAGAFFRKAPLLFIFNSGYQSFLSDRKGNSLSSNGDDEWCCLMQLAGYTIWFDERLHFEHLLAEKRLNWPYYLRLKQGIASGNAPLFIYHYMLLHHKAKIISGLWAYLRQAVKFALIVGQFQFKKLFNAYSREDSDLGAAVLSAKYRSFIRHIPLAKKQFESIRQLQTTLQTASHGGK